MEKSVNSKHILSGMQDPRLIIKLEPLPWRNEPNETDLPDNVIDLGEYVLSKYPDEPDDIVA